MSLTLSAKAVGCIEAHAQAHAPHECIGVVTSSDRVIRLTNVAPVAQRHHRYEADPVEWMQVAQAIEDHGERVKAIYHSHPDTRAIPSGYDLAHAAYPGVAYVIASLLPPVITLRAWLLDGSEAVEVPLHVR